MGSRHQHQDNPLSADAISEDLDLRRVARSVLVFERTGSTNDVCWGAANQPQYDGLCVFAEYQTAGRGRQGRPWVSPERKSLLFSTLLLYPLGADQVHLLTLAAGVALAEALESTGVFGLGLKWPNDLVAGNRKLAGIMVEVRTARKQLALVLGIGLNVNQCPTDFSPPLDRQATSLAILTGSSYDRIALARRILSSLDQWVGRTERAQEEDIHAAWMGRAVGAGKTVRLMRDGQRFVGRMIDVCPTQGLLVDLGDGHPHLFAASTTTVEP